MGTYEEEEYKICFRIQWEQNHSSRAFGYLLYISLSTLASCSLCWVWKLSKLSWSFQSAWAIYSNPNQIQTFWNPLVSMHLTSIISSVQNYDHFWTCTNHHIGILKSLSEQFMPAPEVAPHLLPHYPAFSRSTFPVIFFFFLELTHSFQVWNVEFLFPAKLLWCQHPVYTLPSAPSAPTSPTNNRLIFKA